MPRYRDTARKVWLTGRIVKQALADDALSGTSSVDPRFRREFDGIDDRIEEEDSYQTYAARRQLDEARSAAAAAKARLNAAAPKDKRAARIAKNDADGALKRTERAARKAGI